MWPVNIALIGAHQDDEMFCLGTLLKFRAQKRHRFSFIYLTNGEKGISDDPKSDYAATAKLRAREVARVAKEFKGTLDIIPNPDEGLFDSYTNRLAVLECIRRHKIDLVFTHYTSEYNLDHNITSEIVFQATMLANIASIRTESPALKRDPKIFYMNPGEGYGFEGTHFVEIPARLVDEMIRIMGHHKSQMDVARRMLVDYRVMIRERLRRVGERVGVPYAEVYRPCLADRRVPLASMLPS
jgi:LmbE family N-acetylglucosaminyl deacetylase